MTLSRRQSWAAMALVLLVGLAVRLVPWSMTFTPQGVLFRSDTDPYYHVLRAQRIVRDWPRVPWTDARMNFPYGAEVPWPPFFDFTIAALAKVFGSTGPEGVATAAAWLALAFGVVLLPLVAVTGRRLLGGGLWLDAALLVALLPAAARFGAIGAADQHGAELVISTAIFLAFVSSWREAEPRRHPAVASAIMGLLIAVAFWNWLGSALYLLVLVGATALWHVLAPAGDAAARAMARSLFVGGLVGALLLAMTILLFAPAGALGRGGLNGLTGLHVAMCFVSAAFGGVLAAASRRAAVRLATVAVAAVLSLLPLVLVPSLRDGVRHGIAAVSRGNAWFASIAEYRPMFFSGSRTLGGDVNTVLYAFGLGLFAMPFAAIPMWRRWGKSQSDRPALFFLFFWGATFLVLTLAELRFQLYLTIPLALWVAFGARALGKWAAGRWPAKAGRAPWLVPLLSVLLVASPALEYVWKGGYAIQQPGFESDLFPSLAWLRSTPPTDPSRPSVMAEWAVGHAVQYFGGKPAIATPFGTEEGELPPRARGSLADWAEFLFSPTPEAAEDVLARRRAGFVLLRSPKNEVLSSFGFAPPGTPPVAELKMDWLQGPMPSAEPGFLRLVPSRLYYFDGMPPPGDRSAPALGGYRLLYESAGTEWVGNFPPAHLWKAFGVVPGARIVLKGTSPGATVTAQARIQTNQKRVFEWSTRTTADDAGRAELRLPYATGSNGLINAGSYSISDGAHQGTLDLDEKDVLGGRMEIDLTH